MAKSEILVSCNDQVLKITDAPVLASGGLNEICVAFSFCEKWDGFVKTAIFYRDEENVYYAVLDENDTCIVPWEVCYEEGTFYFSVFGEKADTRRTASVVRYKVKKGAITTDMLPSDPTPAVYDQIVAMLAEQAGFMTEARSAVAEANTATENANTATNNANTATANANQAAENANTMAAFANESATSANTATASVNEAIANANQATNEARAATEETNTARETFLQEAGEILESLSDAEGRFSELEETLNGNRAKYIDGETCKGWTSATGTTWTLTDGNYQWLILPVNANDVVDIGTNKQNNTYVLFLKSFSPPVVGETIDFADAVSGYRYYDHTSATEREMPTNVRNYFVLGHEVSVPIPAGVNYLLLSTVVGGTSYPLEYLRVNGSDEYGPCGLVGTVEALENKVEGLTEAIDALSAPPEEANIAIDNPYVRAYLMNTQYSTGEWDETNGHPYFTREDISAYSQYAEGGKDKATPFVVNIAPYDGALSYKVIVAENPSYTNAKELNATTGENKISWLKVNRMYWVKTVATTADGDVLLSEKTIETNGARRLNPLTSVQNMRDFGEQTTVDGRKLKQGLLYRSGRLMWITAEDVRVLENILGLKLVVGLASNTEDDTLFSDNVETYNMNDAGFPLEHGWDTLNTVGTRQRYITYLRKIIESLSQGKPVLFHCNGGADRTGLMSAIIEGLCGVSENDICKDYELTSLGLESGTIQTGNPRMLSRTRLGSKNEDGTYTALGFDDGLWYVRQQSGCETYADQWKKILQSADLAVDGFDPLTDAEVEALRKALIVEK